MNVKPFIVFVCGHREATFDQVRNAIENLCFTDKRPKITVKHPGENNGDAAYQAIRWAIANKYLSFLSAVTPDIDLLIAFGDCEEARVAKEMGIRTVVF